MSPASLFERAAVIPGRSLTRSKKVFERWAGSGQGARIYDTDGHGHEHIDMLCGLGAISLGYTSTREFTDYWEHGVYSLPHELEIETAEAVLQHVAPWASHVRFVKTGSEATHAAYRIAKAATGRPHVLVGDWAYHGWHEWCADPAFPFTHRFAHGEDLGYLPACFRDERHRIAVPYTDIAAVFVEPHRWESVDVAWLQIVRQFCDRIGALLVFDSMIYGGRWALGGTSAYFGVTPDLECFGKAYGNGEAVAFVVGRDALAQHGEMISGTYAGCTTGLQAVCDTLQTYTTEPVIDTLWARGWRLADGLEQVLASYPGLAVREGQPVHQRIRFLQDEATHGKRFSDAMAQRGILWHPGCANVMYAHTVDQIDRVIEAAAESLKELYG